MYQSTPFEVFEVDLKSLFAKALHSRGAFSSMILIFMLCILFFMHEHLPLLITTYSIWTSLDINFKKMTLAKKLVWDLLCSSFCIDCFYDYQTEIKLNKFKKKLKILNLNGLL